MSPLREPSDVKFGEVPDVEGEDGALLTRRVVKLGLVRHGFPPHLPEAHDVKAAQAQSLGCGDVNVGVQSQSQRILLARWQFHCP